MLRLIGPFHKKNKERKGCGHSLLLFSSHSFVDMYTFLTLNKPIFVLEKEEIYLIFENVKVNHFPEKKLPQTWASP